MSQRVNIGDHLDVMCVCVCVCVCVARRCFSPYFCLSKGIGWTGPRSPSSIHVVDKYFLTPSNTLHTHIKHAHNTVGWHHGRLESPCRGVPRFRHSRHAKRCTPSARHSSRPRRRRVQITSQSAASRAPLGGTVAVLHRHQRKLRFRKTRLELQCTCSCCSPRACKCACPVTHVRFSYQGQISSVLTRC